MVNLQIIWRLGNISADMPMQIYDIDGDGYDEVITAKNFEVLILDGKTGNVKKRAKTPLSTIGRRWHNYRCS